MSPARPSCVTSSGSGVLLKEGLNHGAFNQLRIHMRSFFKEKFLALLGRHAVEVKDSLSEADLDAFEALLRESDNDIYNWVTEREPLPAHLDNAFMAALITFNRAE